MCLGEVDGGVFDKMVRESLTLKVTLVSYLALVPDPLLCLSSTCHLYSFETSLSMDNHFPKCGAQSSVKNDFKISQNDFAISEFFLNFEALF